MPDDSDHVLDSIDGAVDEWLAMSDDSMRWTPPETVRSKPVRSLPVPPFPQVLENLLHEVEARLGPPAQAVVDAFRPLGEGVVDAVSTFLDSPPVRHLLDPPEDPGAAGPGETTGPGSATVWADAVGAQDTTGERDATGTRDTAGAQDATGTRDTAGERDAAVLEEAAVLEDAAGTQETTGPEGATGREEATGTEGRTAPPSP
ncbi:hypothetical protein [Streptosporangium longisporum]|uniref:Uncharacterized protein n=1 Tax=Streptosporangium longisporum TaxID=46187 RepID=A0ABP6LDY1_9ACTN